MHSLRSSYALCAPLLLCSLVLCASCGDSDEEPNNAKTNTSATTPATSGTSTTSETSTTSDTSSEGPTLNLPPEPYNYANIQLSPRYEEGGEVATIRFDNTPPDNPITDHGATLGRVLFYDTTLSQNYTVSCANCHQQKHGFSDPEVFSVGFNGERTERHSMGLDHARFSHNGRFFWDERAATLEEQVLIPIQDPIEMGLTLEELEQRVSQQPYYPELFRNAFGDETVTSDRIARALSQFVRSIVSTQTRFDIGFDQVESLGDDFPNFTEEENYGKILFFVPIPRGGAGCFVCHGTEAFINLVPRNNGLDADTSADQGVGGALGRPELNGFFRIPSLRNIGVRPPYMHDGRFDTLEEVVGFYNNRIQPHPNLAPQLLDANGDPVKLRLRRDDLDAIVAFLHTLTDESMANDPKYSNPFPE